MSDQPHDIPATMREPVTFSDDASDVLDPPLDLGALTFGDVPDGDDFATPDASASREPRRSPFTRRQRAERTAPRTRTTTRAKAVPKARPGAFVEPLTNVYTMIGALLSPMDGTCGGAIIAAAPECARTLDALAQQNDAVRRALFALTQTSAIGAVAMAHAPIAMAVALHHVPAVTDMQAKIGARLAESFANNNSSDDTGAPEA